MSFAGTFRSPQDIGGRPFEGISVILEEVRRQVLHWVMVSTAFTKSNVLSDFPRRKNQGRENHALQLDDGIALC